MKKVKAIEICGYTIKMIQVNGQYQVLMNSDMSKMTWEPTSFIEASETFDKMVATFNN